MESKSIYEFEKYFESDLEDLKFNEGIEDIDRDIIRYEEGRLQGMLDAMFWMGIIEKDFYDKKSNELKKIVID